MADFVPSWRIEIRREIVRLCFPEANAVSYLSRILAAKTESGSNAGAEHGGAAHCLCVTFSPGSAAGFGVVQEPRPYERGYRVQVEQRQEVDGLELAAECGRPANFRVDGKVGAEQLWNFRRLLGQVFERTIESGQGLGAPSRATRSSPLHSIGQQAAKCNCHSAGTAPVMGATCRAGGGAPSICPRPIVDRCHPP
jgi:hypothetical protein